MTTVNVPIFKDRPDMSTPVDAAHLTAWGVAIKANADAAEAAEAGATAPTDAMVASLVPDAGSVTGAALAATYAPTRRGTFTNLWGYLGDSITYGSLAAAAGGFVSFVGRFSNQSMRLKVRAGHSGYRADQLLPYVQSEIVAGGATSCFLLVGTNDAGQGVTPTVFIANTKALFSALTDAGVVFAVGTVPPRADVAGVADLISQYNAWIRSYCPSVGIPVVDVHAALVDTSTGGYLTAYDGGDGIHPNLAGHQVIAQTVAAALLPLVPPMSSPLATSNVGAANLFANGLMLTDAGADGIADSWTTTGTATPTYSLVTDATKWLGKAQRIALPTGSAYRRLEQSVTSGFAPGDTLGIGAVVTIANAGANTVGFKLDLVYTGGTGATVSLFGGAGEDVARIVVWQEFVVAAGATAIRPRYTCQQSGSAVTYDIAQATLINLTALGLA